MDMTVDEARHPYSSVLTRLIRYRNARAKGQDHQMARELALDSCPIDLHECLEALIESEARSLEWIAIIREAVRLHSLRGSRRAEPTLDLPLTRLNHERPAGRAAN